MCCNRRTAHGVCLLLRSDSGAHSLSYPCSNLGMRVGRAIFTELRVFPFRKRVVTNGGFDVESAVAQPRARFGGKDLYPKLADKAAALGQQSGRSRSRGDSIGSHTKQTEISNTAARSKHHVAF